MPLKARRLTRRTYHCPVFCRRFSCFLRFPKMAILRMQTAGLIFVRPNGRAGRKRLDSDDLKRGKEQIETFRNSLQTAADCDPAPDRISRPVECRHSLQPPTLPACISPGNENPFPHRPLTNVPQDDRIPTAVTLPRHLRCIRMEPAFSLRKGTGMRRFYVCIPL